MPAQSISVTHQDTRTENTFHPQYPKQPMALAGICNLDPYFNFNPLKLTNSILVAFPHKGWAMQEMSPFSCCINKTPNQRHFWAVFLSISIKSKLASTREGYYKHNILGHAVLESLCSKDDFFSPSNKIFWKQSHVFLRIYKGQALHKPICTFLKLTYIFSCSTGTGWVTRVGNSSVFV